MALNYWHSDFSFIPVESLCRKPSDAQVRVFRNAKRLLKAFGSCQEEFQVPTCGRRLPVLVSLLSDLSELLTWEGAGGDPYFRSFPGAPRGLAEVVPRDLSRVEELVPYRSLDPERLKLSGSAQWDPEPYLSDTLWMAYVEPASLLWTEGLRTSGAPCVDREDPEAVAGLVPIWDARGLMFLRDEPLPAEGRDLAMRFFNCYKSSEVDRVIGDRWARNYVEGRCTVVSPGLPSAQCLLDLEIKPGSERFSLCCTDRKDFYHQFQVNERRAASNACFPLLPLETVKSTKAFEEWCSRNLKKKKYDRLVHGDLLKAGKGSSNVMKEVPNSFQLCFRSIPQGDHLGVEFATDARRSLLKEAGLLVEGEEMRSGASLWSERNASGLVIDDFFSISRLPAGTPSFDPEGPDDQFKSKAVRDLIVAKDTYEKEGIIGSDDKDIWDAPKAKLIGAEIDSSLPARRLGLATVAAPARKRLSLA